MGVQPNEIKKLQEQLDEWGCEIDKLKAKLGQAKPESRQAYAKQIEELELMHETAAEILKGFKEISEDKQEVVKEVMVSAWDSLGKAVKSADAPGSAPNSRL